MKTRILLLTALICLLISATYAQVVPVHPRSVATGTYYGLSKPLRDIPPMTKAEFQQLVKKGKKNELNEGLGRREYPFAATALPKGPDPAWQNFMGSTKSSKAPIVSFGGQGSPYYPPDCNGTVGHSHFMQLINCVYAIYDKSGTLLAGPTNLNLIFGSVPGANRNDGDPVILYDDQADRYVVTEFSIPNSGTNYIMFAVSATNDPLGSWHQYSFPVDAMPDYPKFSVWRDGYYMGDNNSSGNDIYVYERNQMLNGGTAQVVAFNNAWRPTSVDGFMCVPPIDNDGPAAPAGAPGMYIAFNDDALGGGTDQLWLYELSVNWTTPASSTFVRTQQLDVQPFSSSFGNNWNNIDQKGTTQRVDGIPQVIMNVPQYRNFGGYQTIVCCHTVNVDGAHHAGIRWYELRKTSSTWSVRQQGTYAPDAESRWMGSIMLNGSNEIALGYSISSTNMFPSIKFCGQSATAYAAGAGLLDIAEDTIHMGTNSQTGANRWGDYSQMSVDPTDDKTFWYTDEYGGNQKTWIASFKFSIPPTAATVAADSVRYYSANLNGLINPNGLPTTYFFRYGTSPFAMHDSTAVANAGSGVAPVTVTSQVSGLLSGTKYYFRVFANSAGGPASGSNMNFTTPVAPFLAILPPNQNVPAWSGNTNFQVNSNTTWSVSSDAAWCTITSPASASNNDTIKTAYLQNTSVTPRVANINVTGIGVSVQSATVTQEGVAPMLSVTPPNRNVDFPAGTTTFSVSSNTSWSVVSDVSWCTVTPSGSMNGIITATFTENTGLSSRVCSVTVTVSGIPSETVTVTQAAFVPMISVTPPNQDVTATAGSTAFQVVSNVNWTVVSDAAWCVITPSGSGNGTIVADFTQNTANTPRVANISVTGTSLPVQTVKVTQAKSSIGIDEIGANTIGIYPNPTRGIFRIVPGQAIGATMDISVQDLTGKVILHKQCSGAREYEIDLSSAAKGTYHVIVKTETKLLVKKLVIIK